MPKTKQKTAVMKKYLLLIIGLSWGVVNAQISISTYKSQVLIYDSTQEKYIEHGHVEKKNSFFEINENITMAELTTPKSTYHFKIKDYTIEDTTGVLYANAVCDSGNEYKLWLDKEYHYLVFEYEGVDTSFATQLFIKGIWGDGVDILTPRIPKETKTTERNAEPIAEKESPISGKYSAENVSDYAWDNRDKKYKKVQIVGEGKLIFSGDIMYFKRGTGNWLDNSISYKGFHKEKKIHIYKDKRGQKFYITEALDKLTYYYDYDEKTSKYLSATVYKNLTLIDATPSEDFINAPN